MSETRRTQRLALAVLAVVAISVFSRHYGGWVPDLIGTAQDKGYWAGVAYIVVYALATVAWVPGSLLTLSAGAVFGLTWGTLYTLIGATLGATLAFLVSRYLARGAVERRLAESPRLQAVSAAIERRGGLIVLLLRLSPLFPFNALNYVLGVMPVRVGAYVAASFVGMAPGTFLYTYAGHAGGRIVADAASGGPEGAAQYLLLFMGLLATGAVTIVITRIARRALQEVA